MAFVGPGHYVVVVIHVLPNEEHADAAVRELHEETGLTLTPDDLTLLSDAHVRVALPKGRQLVYVFSASVPVVFATSHLRTLAQVEQAVTTHSTINPDGTYVVPESINIDGLNLTPAKTGLLPVVKHKSELLHFGYVTQWETFCRAVYSHSPVFQDDTSIPRLFFMYSRFTTVDSGY